MYRLCTKFNIFNARINSCTVNSNEINILGINIHIKLLEAHPADSRILLLFFVFSCTSYEYILWEYMN